MVDVIWVGIAFVFGLAARQVGLPPLVGYLVAGFVLYGLDVQPGETLEHFSQLGITLLLFTVGLKLRVGTLLRPQVWGVASLHMMVMTALLGAVVLGLAGTGIGLLTDMGWPHALLIGFALSYSSTVFAVKVLEERSDLSSVYGRTAIGILIVQDIAAVAFLAISAAKAPSPWALAMLAALWPLRWLLWRLLNRAGHGELLVLFGLTAAVGGSQLFELASVKGDLGALIIGVLLASHRSSDELAKSLLAFKDLFLIGFFLSVGLHGIPGPEALLVALLLVALIPVKSGLYFWLLTRFRMRARTSLLTTLGLSNYSEFGLIIAALATAEGWLSAEWLTTLALALALSFVAAAPANAHALRLYETWRDRLRRFQYPVRLPEEQYIQPGDAGALIFGMGRVGSGAYDQLMYDCFGRVVAVDSAADVVERHRAEGREVIRASGTDLDFWDRLRLDTDTLKLVLLALPRVEENVFAAQQLRRKGFRGRIGALVKYADDEERLTAAGVDRVYNLYSEAGAGLAEDACRDQMTDNR